MKLFFLVPLLLLLVGCSRPHTQDDSEVYTTKLTEADSLGTSIQSTDEEFGYKPDYYLAKENPDPSDIKIINKSCVILIEATAAQTQARLEEQQAESDRQHAEWEKAKAAWEKQPHDSTETFEDEQSYFGSEGADDVSYYQWQAQKTFDELKIDTVTIKKEGYVKLIGLNKKVWTLDIRSNMTPDWTLILFDVNKEPKVVDAIDVTRERVMQYYLLNPSARQ